MGSKQGCKLWSGDFILILAIALLSYIWCQGLNNGTPIYVGVLGGSNAFAGMLILEFSIAAAIARIAIGRSIDTRSRRSFMILGAVLMLVGTGGVLPFPFLESQIVFRAIQGAGFGAITTAASTSTADVAPTSRLGEALGYYGLGQSLGFAVGPSLAIVLTSFAWHETLFAGMAIVSLCLVVLGFACSYEQHPERLDPTSAFARSAARAGGGERRGAASALYGLANDAGIGVGAIVWGAVIDATGYTIVFWGGAAMLVAAFISAAIVFPRA